MKSIRVELTARIDIDDNLEQRLQGQPAMDKLCAVCQVSFAKHGFSEMFGPAHTFVEDPPQDYEALQTQAYTQLREQIENKLGLQPLTVEITGIEP